VGADGVVVERGAATGAAAVGAACVNFILSELCGLLTEPVIQQSVECVAYRAIYAEGSHQGRKADAIQIIP
jgi:hypothetical protein